MNTQEITHAPTTSGMMARKMSNTARAYDRTRHALNNALGMFALVALVDALAVASLALVVTRSADSFALADTGKALVSALVGGLTVGAFTLTVSLARETHDALAAKRRARRAYLATVREIDDMTRL